MKRILTLILLFTITLYSIPSEAYTLNGNDIPLVQTKNLFDKDGDLVLDEVILGTGGTQVLVGSFYTNYYIAILPSTTYHLSAANADNLRIPFYDSSFNFISRTLLSGTSQSFTTPSNAFYLRISMAQLNLNSIQLELGSTATSYANYGFYTLNQLFNDNNEFLNNYNTWTTSRASFNLIGNDYVLDPDDSGANTFARGMLINTPIINDLFIYSRVSFKVEGGSFYVGFYSSYTNTASPITQSTQFINTPLPNQIYSISHLSRFRNTDPAFATPANNTHVHAVFQANYTGFSTPYSNTVLLDYEKTIVLNLTALGLTNLTKDVVDYYYQEYERNKAFIEGYNAGYAVGYNEGYDEGYDLGYDEGFDDGVASDTSYAVGYALGLSEGQDMETGSSLLILVVAAIGFIMMIFGFTTKRGIFNLLSVGAFVVLGTLLAQFVGFIIITAGLVIINVYYAFFGNS